MAAAKATKIMASMGMAKLAGSKAEQDVGDEILDDVAALAHRFKHRSRKAAPGVAGIKYPRWLILAVGLLQ